MSCQDPTVVLVGIGVVGEAILHAHLDAGVSLVVADIDPSALQQATTKAISGRSDFKASSATWPTDGLNAVALVQRDASIPTIRQADCRLVIESIPERLPIKQAFYAELETWCGPQDVLCSNTSTLRLADIASQMTRAERLAGLHFFMPVAQRSGVEVVRHPRTDPSVISACRDHCRRIGKTAIEVKDSPGFVVNRMLTPYLNEALRLLTAGAKPDQLSAAAMAYGMPLSPLELIDWIGTRTAFDAGRGFWQAFP
ncbi:MAG: 3-hydroxyacyl-CoA dehydrogenase family protein, partial [Planctomycetota bacterium]